MIPTRFPTSQTSDGFINPWIQHSSSSARFFWFSYILPNLLSNNLITLSIAYTFFIFFSCFTMWFSLFCWDEVFRNAYIGKIKQYFIYHHLHAPPYFSLFQIFSVYYSYQKTQPTNLHPTHTELLADYLTTKLLVSHAILGKFLLKYKTLNPLYTFNNVQRFSHSL